METINFYLDYPRAKLGARAQQQFKELFVLWANKVRNGEDLEAAALAVGGDLFWDLLGGILYPISHRINLRSDLKRTNSQVVFHVRKPPTKTGRTRGDNVWFAC